MKTRFEVGKTYDVNGGGTVTVTRRTRCYVTVSGPFAGRYYVGDVKYESFLVTENLLNDHGTPYKSTRPCFAFNETNR